MRKLFIAMIAGGFLLLSGVVASAKLDAGNAGQGQDGQQQTQNQQDKKPAVAPATKPATPATKPATPAPKPAATTAECGETGDNTGDHQNDDINCNDQNEQAGAAESKTNANATAEKGGNNED
jgi:hypothetical protein